MAAGNATPPDTTGAIGPDQYVEMVNEEIGAYDRADLSFQESLPLDEFVGAAGDSVFDPQIQWDPTADRWLYVADDIAGLGDNFLAFGWSKDASATPLGPDADGGNWCSFFIVTGTEFEDYPKLGHSDDFIVLGTNVFDDSGGPDQDEFLTSRIWAIPKPANGDTSCTTPTEAFFFGEAPPGVPLTDADGELAFTPVPANTFEGSTNGFVVAAQDPTELASANRITAWHVERDAPDPPDLLLDGGIDVAPYDVPANVPQPGTGAVLDSLDARLTQAVAKTDLIAGELAVWTQHTVAGAGGRSVARWYELLPDSLTRFQQGTISDPAQFVFNAAVSSTAAGSSAVINHNVGGSTLRAQIRSLSRQAATPLGQMGGSATLGASAAADQDFTCFAPFGPPCRWGDYAGASPDPANPFLVWGSNQTLGPPSIDDPHWRTRNFALLPGATAPDTTIGSGPAQGATVDTARSTFGFSSDDPGASFRCRLDGGAQSACASPRTIGPLPNGQHSFEVVARGAGGIADPSAASRSFTVDAPGPTTEITKGPKGKRRTKKKRFKAKFRFEAADPELAVVGFECRLDGGDFDACTSPHRVKVRAKRKAKAHKFRVRATNEVGTTGEPAKRKWRVKRKSG